MAPNLDASLVAEDARLPAGQLRKLNATFKAVPISSGSDAMRRIQLSGDARASGLALKDPALAKAVGTEASSVLRGTSTTNGVVYFDTLELKSSTVQGRFDRSGGIQRRQRTSRRRRAGSCEVRRVSSVSPCREPRRSSERSKERHGQTVLARRSTVTRPVLRPAVRPQMASLEVELT